MSEERRRPQEDGRPNELEMDTRAIGNVEISNIFPHEMCGKRWDLGSEICDFFRKSSETPECRSETPVPKLSPDDSAAT